MWQLMSIRGQAEPHCKMHLIKHQTKSLSAREVAQGYNACLECIRYHFGTTKRENKEKRQLSQ